MLRYTWSFFTIFHMCTELILLSKTIKHVRFHIHKQIQSKELDQELILDISQDMYMPGMLVALNQPSHNSELSH